jgi:hypothetical protein
MHEILPGLWHWTTEHPGIGARVSSYVAADARVVLDPLLPEGGTDRLAQLRVDTVALTCRHHRRDSPAIQAALGARVLVPEPGLHEYADDDELRVEGYADGDRIARGVTALALGAIAPDDFVLHLDVDHGVLAFADGVTRMGGDVGFVPDDLMDDPPTVKARTAARVAELLELPFDGVLFAHGDPLPSGGKAALRRWLDTL